MRIRNYSDLTAVGQTSLREVTLDSVEAGLAAVDPYASTKRLVRRVGNRLFVGGHPEMDVSGFGDETIDLSDTGKVYVIGAGKAVQLQALALEEILGDRLSGGAITVKRGEGCLLRKVRVTEGAHPVPDEDSVVGTQRIVEIAESARDGDLVFTLFSSGASSLFVQPSPAVDLADVRHVYKLAIKHGHQTIIHRIMPYFSTLSSGRIIGLAAPARTVNLISALDRYPRWHGKLNEQGSWIPSWPPGPRRMAEAAGELRREAWWKEIPSRMRDVLEQAQPEHEVPALEEAAYSGATYWQPVDSHSMLEAAKARAEALGVRALVLGSWYWTDCGATAQVMAGMVREILEHGNPAPPPVALISGGELTVPVGTTSGVGGRNQEFVLRMALELRRFPEARFCVAAVDSDGTDGPGEQLLGDTGGDSQCLAGGIVDARTLATARDLGLDLAVEVRNHNASVPLLKLGSGIFTGNTGTCSGDLRVVLVQPGSGEHE